MAQLDQLEQNRDHVALVEALEAALASEAPAASKAAWHLKLGRVLQSRFLQSVKALKHFQDAYKANPALIEALGEARAIYWQLGKLNMVQKLLELELKAPLDGARAAELLIELADVSCDLGDDEKATATYARAVAATEGKSPEASDCLEDAQASATTWEERVGELLRAAHASTTAAGKSRLFVRAARIARRFAPEAFEGMLEQAYVADPASRQAAALYENLFADGRALEGLRETQAKALGALATGARAAAAHDFGARWFVRHQNVDFATELLASAFDADPSDESALAFLREVWGARAGQWDRVVALLGGAHERGPSGAAASFVLGELATITWRQLGDLMRAKAWFEKLAAIDPENAQLRAFEAQIGETLARTSATPAVKAQTPAPPVVATPVEAAPPVEAPASVDPTPASSSPASIPAASGPVDDAKIAELRALAAKQEAAKRFNEYVRTIVQLAGAVADRDEKISLYQKAAELYVGKFANQAEAVKQHEAILAIDPDDAGSIDFLRQMYEKRRDWEKLLGLQRREAAREERGPSRAARFVEMAKLATERVKKPEICIELWNEVLDSDAENVEALTNLSHLFERARDFAALAGVLRKLAEVTFDAAQKIQILGKLATTAGDRLGDDEGAIEAWRALLALDPNDRKAQETLKKKYLQLGRWDELDVFFVDSGKWDELIRLLESQETKEQDKAVKIGLLLKIAKLWSERKQKNDRAAKAYEKILELEPDHLGAADELVPIYEQAANHKGLATAIEVKLRHETDEGPRLELLREVARIYETKSKDAAKAFDRFLAAFEIRPIDDDSAADVERTAKSSSRWDDVVAAYRKAIDAALASSDEAGAITLRLRLARVLVDELGRVDDALAELRAVHELEGDNVEALAALEKLYRQTSRFDDLLGIYEKKRDLAIDPDEKREILIAIARLFEHELGDAKKAIESYRAVVDADPADAVALEALDRLFRETGDFASYVEVLRRRIELEGDEAKLLDLKFRLGETLDAKLDDAVGALECYREILAIDPAHEGARTRLEGLLANDSLKAESAAILQNIYELRGDWQKLVGVLEILAQAEGDVPTRVSLRRKIARIASESLGDAKLAFEAQSTALRDEPSDLGVRAELEGYAVKADMLVELDQVMESIAASLSDVALARDYWLYDAHIDERLGKIDESANGYLHILSLDPSDEEALSSLEALYGRAERWEPLIDIYRRRVELAVDPVERESLYSKIATIYDERLGRPADAITAYRDVLAGDPASIVALRALDVLYSRGGQHSDLAENLEAQLALAEGDESQIALMLRLASLREGPMARVPEAIEGYRQVLDRDPSNGAAEQALERLGKDPAHEVAIAEILEPIYRAAGDWQKLVGVHEVQIRRADDVARRVELLQAVASLYEDAASDPSAAFDTLARALAEEPTNEATQERIDRLARVASRIPDLARVYEERAASVGDVEVASGLFSIAARVCRFDLGDAERAIALYRQVRAIAPSNLDAIVALEELYRAGERFAELSEVLQRRAELVDDVDEKKRALQQAAQIEEEVLGRPEAAIAVYVRVLEVDGEDVYSLDALIRLYLQLSKWNELLDVYGRKVDLVSDVDDKKRIFYQMGAVYERELGDADRAIETYAKALELDPDDLTALGRLDALYVATKNWQELLTVLVHEAELATGADDAVAFQYRIAEVYDKSIGDVSRAIDLYREILARDPGHAPTLAALEAIKSGDRDPLGAAGVLEPVYEAAGAWTNLVSVLEVQASRSDDVPTRVDLLRRIAELYEASIGDAGAAFDTMVRAVAADSAADDSRATLERLAPMVGRWAEVASLYDRELAKLEAEPERFVELGLRLAEIYETCLGDVASAIERHRRVVAVDGENLPAVRALDRLYVQTSAWGDLAQILAREAEIAPTPDDALELKHRLGKVRETKLDDVDGAIAAFREVLAAAPEHTATLDALEAIFATGARRREIGEILEPLYQSAGEWEKLLRVQTSELEAITDADERLAMLYRMAEVAEEKLLDTSRALGIFIRALGERPLDERVGEEVERLAAVNENGWDTLANAYADVLGSHAAVDVRASLGRRLARVFEEQLSDVAKAEDTYKYVLSVDPADADALANLDRIYTSLEQWPELAGVLEERVKGQLETYELVDLWARLGQAYDEKLGRVDDAIRAYRKIFDDLDKTHENAIAALARIYDAKGAWTDLDVVYQRELDNASGDVQEAEIRAKIAELASDRLGDDARAIETWKRVLDLRGEDPEALAALSRLYERGSFWAELADVLERQYDIADEDEERVRVLGRRAHIFLEKLRREDQALADFQRVLDVDFANLDALRSTAAIWRGRADANELVAALHALVDRAAAMLETDELTAIYRELGKTYGEVLGQPFDAADAWRKLLDVEPRDFDAMAALEAIYRAQEQWADVVAVKLQRAEALEGADEKIRELLEVCAIWDEPAGDRDKATPAYEKILAIDPTHEGAFTALEELHSAAGRWEALVELYLNRLGTRESASEKTDLLRRIARVFEEKLDDKNQAVDALVNAFAEDYSDDETVRYLERLVQATGRWNELLASANAWLQAATDPSVRVVLLVRIAKWYGEDQNRPEYAQTCYEQALQIDPKNVSVLRSKASLYRKHGQWQALGQTLSAALDVATDERARKEILTELGELLEREMGEIDQALVYYHRALEIDPDHVAALDALERIYDARGKSRELVDVLARKVKALSDAPTIVATKLRMGELYEGAARDLDKAVATYRDVLELDADSLDAMRGLERAYQAKSSWHDLAAILERQLEAVPSERERIEVLMKLAAIEEEQFVKPDLAAARLERVLEIDPTHEPAFVALERCYRRMRSFRDLIGAYERHIGATLERATKIDIYGHIAVVYADELDEPESAIEAYRNVVDLDDTSVPALEALAKLYEKQGDSAQAIESMTRVADLTTDGKQRVEMYFRIGKALDEKLGDRVAAQERFEMALDLDPSHLPTLGALRALAIDQADWDRAARFLDQEQLNTSSARQRAKLLVELGKLREEMLGDHAGAVEAFELALSADGDNEDAAQPLLDDYVQREKWAEAEPLGDLLVRKAGKRERTEQHALWKTMGKIASSLGKDEKALKAYGEAHKLDLTDHETIRGLADVSFRMKDWATALANYQKVLTSLDDAEIDARTDVYFRIGVIKREQAQAKQAIGNFEKALSLDAGHRPSLDALIAIYGEMKDWAQVTAYKRQILDTLFDAAERYKLLVEIGDIWNEKAKDAAKTIEAYEEALAIEPSSHELLHKLLQLYMAGSDWQKMVDTLRSIAGLEPNAERKSKYIYTMAQVYRDKLDDPDHAVEAFNETLDLNPLHLEAFERINKILTQGKDWKGLERAFRKMLHRVVGKGNADLEYNLWHNLGIIYRDRLNEVGPGIEAFRMASRIRPDDVVERQILAELYQATDQLDLAVGEQHDILKRDPGKIDAYHALFRIYLKQKRYDAAWCVAAALAFLRKAEGDEQKLYDDHKPQGMLAVKGRLDNRLWGEQLFHPDENLYIGKIFEMIAAAGLSAKMAQLKTAKQLPTLDKRFKQDPATSTVTFAKTFGWAAAVLGIPCPELYVRSDLAGGLAVVPLAPPATVAGQSVLTGYTPQELTFIAGKHLAGYRGEHYLKNIFPTVLELTMLLFAGVKLVNPELPAPAEMVAQVNATATELAKYMQPQQIEGLRFVVKKFIEDGAKANVKRWSQAVDLTSARAGLLLCADLEIARKVISMEPALPGDLTPQEKMKEMLLFAVSEPYFALRKSLGVNIA